MENLLLLSSKKFMVLASEQLLGYLVGVGASVVDRLSGELKISVKARGALLVVVVFMREEMREWVRTRSQSSSHSARPRSLAPGKSTGLIHDANVMLTFSTLIHSLNASHLRQARR